MKDTAPYIATPQPNPEWSPQDVIRLQVAALQHNDDPVPDTGIRAAWAFASPGNRAATGPLERFMTMVKNPLYRSMLNHQHADYGEIQINGNRAGQEVTLLDQSGAFVGYIFVLSRQTGGLYAGCWMTDGVRRVG